MTFIHGKGQVFLFATHDISAYLNNVAYKRSADSHDVTTFGATGHAFQGGLTDGTFTLTGTYDNGASNTPKTLIETALGTIAAVDYREAGTGTGKTTSTANALVTAYEESGPVADMISWTATLQISGAVTVGAQS
jgi:hypothetical protein